MPEIRLNVMTGDWVIISPERATRPANPSAPTPSTQFPAHDKSCPFCKGNESLTPPETHRHQDSQGDWLVRCVPNKFPAVASEGKVARDNSLLFRSISGVGQHEVIIETPRHNETVVWLNRQHFAHVLEVCRHRFLALYEDPRIEHVTLFKNHGREAGASLEHPHTQIVGLPVSPQQVRRRVQETLQHYDGFGHCLGCQMLQEEAKASVRVVSENDGFLCFVPYAALSPYHLWVFPKRHSACFGLCTDEELSQLAELLQTVLRKLSKGLDDPPFNYVFQSLSPLLNTVPYFHWYIAIIPRVSKAAGFEFGTGMFINSSSPKESARFLRDFSIDEFDAPESGHQ